MHIRYGGRWRYGMGNASWAGVNIYKLGGKGWSTTALLRGFGRGLGSRLRFGDGRGAAGVVGAVVGG